MKTKICTSMIALAIVMSGLAAFAKNKQPDTVTQGTVVSVDREEVSSPNQCCYSVTDAPLQSTYYSYKVSLHVGCVTYDGEYDTALDYFPSAFISGKILQVRLAKHEMYFDVPGDSNLKMNIVHRSKDRTAACSDSRASR